MVQPALSPTDLLVFTDFLHKFFYIVLSALAVINYSAKHADLLSLHILNTNVNVFPPAVWPVKN